MFPEVPVIAGICLASTELKKIRWYKMQNFAFPSELKSPAESKIQLCFLPPFGKPYDLLGH